MSMGLRPQDRIAILSENRPEWALIDLAAQMIGLSSVPIYTSLTSSEIQYMLLDSGAKIIAVSNQTLFEKIIPIQKSLPDLKAVIAFDSTLSLSADRLGVPLYLIKNLKKTVPDDAALRERVLEVSPDHIASIIYTSGTTGSPKGVMLTHSNFIRNVSLCKAALSMSGTDVHLSFLPLSHVFERMAGYYLMIHIGATIAYAENMDTVPQNLLEIRPTFILGVPRFYEKIKDRVLDTVEKSSSIKKGLFHWAKALGAEYREAVEQKKKLGWTKNLQRCAAHVLAYKKFSARLGGRVRFCVSGGAPLAKETAEFFYDLGVTIYEGYGLTETSPVITVNRENQFKFGTVGTLLEGIHIMISDEGEILTKSPCVMKGYHHKPEETAAVLKDGWFYTGDLGLIDREGFLSITGRKKELIVTSGGKKIAPRVIEALAEQDPLVLRCVLFGEAMKFITALIVPVREQIVQFADGQKIAYQNYKDLLENPKIVERIDCALQARLKDLANFEKIKYFVLLENDFSQSSGELTPTLKVKREVVISRHKDKLLALYEKNKA
ncbi:MAG: long-chain fatty acid--CoA ligase [Candidatus Omnitrophica bacterium CG07_land_8_20_14_0_80_50_8]|nr:MAG: long-chain fatty acid--CoA ligase [Candidatus Omnitrophica bacterium CG07_land_8_20_14_0_80_50_8]